MLQCCRPGTLHFLKFPGWLLLAMLPCETGRACELIRGQAHPVRKLFCTGTPPFNDYASFPAAHYTPRTLRMAAALCCPLAAGQET